MSTNRTSVGSCAFLWRSRAKSVRCCGKGPLGPNLTQADTENKNPRPLKRSLIQSTSDLRAARKGQRTGACPPPYDRTGNGGTNAVDLAQCKNVVWIDVKLKQIAQRDGALTIFRIE